MSTSINIIKIIKSTTTSGSGRPKRIYEQLKKDPEEEVIDSITNSMNISDLGEDVKMVIPKSMMVLHRHNKEGVVKPAVNFNGLIRSSLLLF